MTKSQIARIAEIKSLLTGNYMLPSMFVSCTVEKTDSFTKSILVTLNFENHYGVIWIGAKGGVRDIDGKNLKKGDSICYLPQLKEY